MNKLAVLAFALLVFFSTMLWYLASGSLNEYLKSQIQLQGQYYSQQTTQVALADFSANEGVGVFTNITVSNPKGYKAQYALIIDEAKIELSPPKIRSTINTSPFQSDPGVNANNALVTTVKQLTINKLTLNYQRTPQSISSSQAQNNILTITAQIQKQLAQDYPEFYPEISAKLYAEKHPQLNAEAYADSHPEAGPIIEHKQTKKKRGKPQTHINIDAIVINKFELNMIKNDMTETVEFNNITLAAVGGEQGIVANQMGGELLLTLLNLAKLAESE